MSGEPARKIYEEGDKNAPRWEPKTVQGGGEGDGKPQGDLREARSLSADEIADKEALADSGISPAIGTDEKSALGIDTKNQTEESDGFWKGGKEKVKGRARLTRRKGVAMIVAGTIGVGGFGFFSFIQGPLAVKHLAEALSRPLSSQNEDSETRMRGLLRFARSGNFTETRVSYFGSRSDARTKERLRERGITFRDASSLGEHKTIRIDKSNFRPGESAVKYAERFAAENRIPVDFMHAEVNGNGIEVRDPSGRNLPPDIERRATKPLISKLFEGKKLGKIVTAVKARPVLNKNGAYSKLHPWKRLEAKVARKAADLDKKRQAKKAERSLRNQQRIEKLKAKLKPAAGPAAAVSGAQMGVCIAREVSHDVTLANHEGTVMPARNEALEAISEGSQLSSNDDFTIMHPEAAVLGHKDQKGNTIWQSKALNGLIKSNAGAGQDWDSATKNSFSNRSPEGDVEATINSLGGDKICSTGAIVAGAALGILAIVVAAPSGGLSIAAYASFQIGTAVGTTAILAVLTTMAVKNFTDKPLEERFTNAPFKGTAMAFGSESLANDLYAKSGGADTGVNATTAMTDYEKAEVEEFKSRSFFARMFDVNDYRSLVGQAAMSTHVDPSSSLTGLANGIFSPSKLFSGLTSALENRAFAADDAQAYDFGFPKYGFKKSELTNPIFEDPYDNASKASVLLDSNSGNYIDRAKKCFGVELTRGDRGWQVDVVDNPDGDPEKDVIPSSADYVNANCAEGNDSWLRIRLFIFDSRTMEAYACYDGDDEACQATGVTSGGAQTSSASTPGDADLKKTITISESGRFITLPSKYSCEGRTTKIDSRIAASLAYLITKYDMCADDGLASGHKSHGTGLGVDIRPRKNNTSKEEWKRTVEAAARDMGWWGDAADEGKTSKGCAPAYSGYGQCVGGNRDIPKWVRWIGYNGDVDHGDPWHIFGGSYAHIHIGWNTPNGDAGSPTIIANPVSEVYTFPAPIPDDLKGLVE